MADKYSTIQQHQPLRTPKGWGAQEKALVVQLDETFDDIYRRFGRLRLEDMGKAFRKQIADDEGNIATLTLDVSGLTTRVGDAEGDIAALNIWAGQIDISVANKYDKVSGITINANGIDITGSKYVRIESGCSLELKTGGTFTVQSGKFNIDASGNVTIDGSGTFSGALSAATGTFAGSLSAATGTFAGTLDASCITSGSISADRIAAHSLSVSKMSGSISNTDVSGGTPWKLDMDAGTLTIGSFSADHISAGTMSADRISGGTLIVGGSNNTNGQIQIKNASGTEIGKITKDGIETSGDLKIKSGGVFSVEANGEIQVSTSASSQSYIRLGEGNFNADYGGGITGRLLSISDSAYLAGSRIISEAVLRNLIYVGPTQPASGNGVVWFKIAEVVNGLWNTSGTVMFIGSTTDVTARLSIAGEALTTATTPFKYKLEFDVYTTSDVTRTITTTITQDNHSGVSVSISTGSKAFTKGAATHISLSASSNSIMGNTTDDIFILFSLDTALSSDVALIKNISLSIEGQSGGVFNVTEIKYIQ